uniref:DUF6532 domain-containing protein n=1 Tax=Mycena chlorophos TaxID=658473 RepID=A0ABQ0KZV2_MYCCL|nr:predicted protein [Mycena chlorophos]
MPGSSRQNPTTSRAPAATEGTQSRASGPKAPRKPAAGAHKKPATAAVTKKVVAGGANQDVAAATTKDTTSGTQAQGKHGKTAGNALSACFVAVAMNAANAANAAEASSSARPQRAAATKNVYINGDAEQYGDNNEDDEGVPTLTPRLALTGALDDKDQYQYQHDDEDQHDDDEYEDEQSEDDRRVPAHQRRPSAKKQQLDEEHEEATNARRQKQHQQAKAAARAAGDEVSDEEMPAPRANTVFPTRDVDTRLDTIKNAARRRTYTDARHGSSQEEANNLALYGKVVFDVPGRPLPQEERQPIYNRAGKRVLEPMKLDLKMPERWEPVPEHIMNPNAHSASYSRSARDHTLEDEDDADVDEGSRAGSPDAGDKRSLSPSVGDDDIRYSARGTSGRVRPTVGKLPEDVKEIVNLTIVFVRWEVLINNGFPTHTEEREMIKRSWQFACNKLELKHKLTAEIYRVITYRFSHTRGEVKSKSRPICESVYTFQAGKSKKTIKHNRKLVEDLKERMSFVFRFPGDRLGIYQNGAIQKIINAMVFANRRDEGPTYPEFFNPFPLRALALIENCLDEWASGTRVNINFTADEYRPIYEAHVAALIDFEAAGAKKQVLNKILTRIHTVGRFNSGAEPLTDDKPKPLMSSQEMAAALENFENGGGLSEDEEDEKDA